MNENPFVGAIQYFSFPVDLVSISIYQQLHGNTTPKKFVLERWLDLMI